MRGPLLRWLAWVTALSQASNAEDGAVDESATPVVTKFLESEPSRLTAMTHNGTDLSMKIVDYSTWRVLEMEDLKLTQQKKYVKFQLEPPSCTAMPDGLVRVSSADRFSIHCPRDVRSVSLHFVNPEVDSTALGLYNSHGGRHAPIMKVSFKGVKPGQSLKRHALQCRAKNVCNQLTFTFIQDLDTYPLLEFVNFDVEPFGHRRTETITGKRDEGEENWRVTLYGDQRTWVTARARKGFKIDTTYGSEWGEVDGVISFPYTPSSNPAKGVLGGNYIELYVTNNDRSVQRKVRIEVDLAEMALDLLSDISPIPGYLEPNFRPHIYTYNLRLPWYSPSANLKFSTLNAKDTICRVDGGMDHSGTFATTVLLPDYHVLANVDIHVECWSRTYPTMRTLYIVHVLRDELFMGGATRPTELDVIGGELLQKFDPAYYGPYDVDLRLDDNSELPWVSFYVKPSHIDGSATVDGLMCDPSSQMSPSFRIELGQTRVFTVEVRTKENHVTERYTVKVARPHVRQESLKRARIFGDIIGWLSAIFSSHRAHIFLQNNFILRHVSSTGAFHSIGATYDAFSSSFNKWNLMPRGGWFVKLDQPIPMDAVAPALAYGGVNIDLHSVHTMSRHVAVGDAERVHLLRTIELDYQTMRSALQFADNVILSYMLLAGISISYLVTWFLYLSKSQNEPGVMRRDYLKWLHPTRFWTFVIDLGIVSWCSSAAGLLCCQQSYDVLLFGGVIRSTTKNIGWLSLFLLLLGPLVAFSFASYVFFTVQKDIVYSKSLQSYHDRQVHYSRGYDRFFPWLPVLDAFFTVEVKDAAPIIRVLDETVESKDMIVKYQKQQQRPRQTIAFSPELRKTPTWFSTSPQDAWIINHEDCSESVASRLLKDQKYNDLLQCGEKDMRAVKTYKRGVRRKMCRVDFDDETFFMTTEARNNCDVLPKHPLAVVGYRKFHTRNSYDHHIQVMGEINLQNMSSLLYYDMTRMKTWVPEQQMGFEHLGRWSNLFAAAPSWVAFYYIVERGFLAIMVMIVAGTTQRAATIDEDGNLESVISSDLYTGSMWAICHLVIAFLLLPTAVTAAKAAWYKAKEDVARGARKSAKIEREIENLFRIWPFRDPDIQARIKVLRMRKRDTRALGLVGCYEWFVARPVDQFVRSSPLLNSFGTWVLCFILDGHVFQEVMKSAALLFVLGGSPLVSLWTNNTGALGAMICTTLAIVSLGWRTVPQWVEVWMEAFREQYFLLRRLCWYSHDLFADTLNLAPRLSYYIKEIAVAPLQGRHINLAYPGFTKQWVRVSMEVDELLIVNSVLGALHGGRIEVTPRQKKFGEMCDHLQQGRFKVHKTVVKTGSFGSFRSSIDRRLPVEISLRQGWHDAAANLHRLVATFQIVNHTGHRNAIRHRHLEDDDSYLSFYTDSKLVPELGDIRRRIHAHGYQVLYHRETHEVSIKGPDMNEGDVYRVTTKKDAREAPSVESGYTPFDIDEQSTGMSARKGDEPDSCFADDVVVKECGKLKIFVPPGFTPNLYEPFRVFPPYDGAPFEVDPTEVYVDWDIFYRVLTLYSRSAQVLNDPYRIEWKVARNPVNLDLETECVRNGYLLLDLKQNSKTFATGDLPNLDTWIHLKCIGSRNPDKSGNTITIDPRDSDAHEFNIPDADLVTAVRTLSKATGGSTKFSRIVKGEGQIVSLLPSCGIPATIVQCTNPVERIYVLEPNFAAGQRVLSARREELMALRSGCENPFHVVINSLTVMSTSEFVNFWKHNGISIEDSGGNRWISPFTETQHPVFRGMTSQVRMVANKFRQHLDARFAAAIGLVQTEITKLASWHEAYADSKLEELARKRDAVDYATRNIQDTDEVINEFIKYKKQYDGSIVNFQYPMIVYERLIQRKPHWETQMTMWKSKVVKWLFQQEAAFCQPFNGGETCLHHQTAEFLANLNRVIRSPEQLLSMRYKSVLHYVVPSNTIRGSRAPWRPDPLVCQPAVVRLWRSDPQKPDTAKFDQPPLWVQCWLKLNGDHIAVMFPSPHDATRLFPRAEEWRHVYGFKIPLKCFDQLILRQTDTVPYGGNDKCLGLRTELTFVKQMQICVDDNHVRRVENDVVENQLKYDEGGNTHDVRLMLGKTVMENDLKNFPTHETFSNGDRHTVYPLQFRVNDLYYPRWRSVQLGSKMYEGHENLDGFNGRITDKLRLATTDDESLAPSSSSSESPSSETVIVKPKSSSVMEEASITSSSESILSVETETKPSSTLFEITEAPETISVTSSTVAVVEERSISEVAAKPNGRYVGTWRNYKYHGYGTLFDDTGDEVYHGEWRSGLRWGKGRCRFVDSFGCKWVYEGNFVADEFCGEGKIELEDKEEISRLEKSDDKRDKFRFVQFHGHFRMPTQKRTDHKEQGKRADRADPDLLQHQSEVHAGLMRKIFRQAGGSEGLVIDSQHDESSYSSRSSSSSIATLAELHLEGPGVEDTIVDGPKTLITDMRRLRSLGPYDISKLGIDFINEVMMGNDTRNCINAFADLPPEQLEALKVHELMLPFRAKWARVLDPMYGYANLADRIERGIVSFADGSFYEGHLMSGLPHGKGFFVAPATGLRYEGTFVEGLPHGYGIMERNAGDMPWQYCGELYKGERHGRGTLTSLDADNSYFYAGNFCNGRLRAAKGGRGHALIDINRKDVKHTASSYDDIKRFVGKLDENGLPVDKGRLEWRDGTVYKGRFKKGIRDGPGRVYSALGKRILDSYWKSDVPDGFCSFLEYPKGDRFCGTYVNGRRHGTGEVLDCNGAVAYKGEFIDGTITGHGQMFFDRRVVSTGQDSAYVGYFKDGHFEGPGKFVWTSILDNIDNQPLKLQGNFVNSQPEGVGKYWDKDGTAFSLKWIKTKGGKSTYDPKSLKAYPDPARPRASKTQLVVDPTVILPDLTRGPKAQPKDGEHKTKDGEPKPKEPKTKEDRKDFFRTDEEMQSRMKLFGEKRTLGKEGETPLLAGISEFAIDGWRMQMNAPFQYKKGNEDALRIETRPAKVVPHRLTEYKGARYIPVIEELQASLSGGYALPAFMESQPSATDVITKKLVIAMRTMSGQRLRDRLLDQDISLKEKLPHFAKDKKNKKKGKKNDIPPPKYLAMRVEQDKMNNLEQEMLYFRVCCGHKAEFVSDPIYLGAMIHEDLINFEGPDGSIPKSQVTIRYDRESFATIELIRARPLTSPLVLGTATINFDVNMGGNTEHAEFDVLGPKRKANIKLLFHPAKTVNAPPIEIRTQIRIESLSRQGDSSMDDTTTDLSSSGEKR